jgi:hypothetical protein
VPKLTTLYTSTYPGRETCGHLLSFRGPNTVDCSSQVRVHVPIVVCRRVLHIRSHFLTRFLIPSRILCRLLDAGFVVSHSLGDTTPALPAHHRYESYRWPKSKSLTTHRLPHWCSFHWNQVTYPRAAEWISSSCPHATRQNTHPQC